MTTTPDVDLAHHGDIDARPGLVDLAVNVRADAPPEWLRRRVAAADLARYPDPSAAVAAIATRHRRPADEVLVTAGATEAFTLVARAFAPRLPVVVHPQFTEPELALRAAGHAVERVVVRAPFRLDARQVPDEADLVVIGNPTNPTSVLHPAETLRSLARPGRLLVIDEAFADCVPGEPESLAEARDVPGLVVVRSLTKTFGLAGLRVGYLLGAADLVARLAAVQSRWAVSTPGLDAAVACTGAQALADAEAWALRLTSDRHYLVEALDALPDVEVVSGARASFVLVRTATPRIWTALADRGFAVRRADTFPGLDEHWIRVAVRDRATTDLFTATLKECS
jgi:histidinol-phosphate aminotransferase